MENKREVISQKIEKYGFNIKTLNIVIAVLVAMFTIGFFVIYSNKKAELNLKSEQYSAMLKQIEQNQLNSIFTNVTPNDGTIDPSKVAEDPIFRNGKEAVVFAFDKFYSYTNYETECTGITHAKAVGVDVEVLFTTKSAKWTDGMEYDQSIRIETKTNFGQSGADEIVYLNGKYLRTGKNLKNNNGTLSADFSGEYKKVESKLTKRPIYLINNQTVLYSKAFSFIRDKDNKIMYYTATIMIDGNAAGKDYGIATQEQGGTSFPKFKEVEISCNIDRNGNLINYTTIEKYEVSKKVVVDVTTTLTNEYITVIKSFNKTPTIPKPQIA